MNKYIKKDFYMNSLTFHHFEYFLWIQNQNKTKKDNKEMFSIESKDKILNKMRKQRQKKESSKIKNRNVNRKQYFGG